MLRSVYLAADGAANLRYLDDGFLWGQGVDVELNRLWEFVDAEVCED